MSVRSPNPTIEQGAYGSIVFVDGDYVVAEDAVGTVLSEDLNGAVAMQAAVDVGGKTFFKGNFSISDTIDLASKAALEGVDFNTTIVQTADKPLFSIVGTAETKKAGISIKNMYLYGTNPASNTGQYGIRMKYTSNIVLDRINFYNLYDGIHAETWFYVTWLTTCNFDSQIEHNAMYLHADADWDANLVFLTNCYIASKGNNVDYAHLMGFIMNGSYFHSSAGSNIYGTRAYGINTSLTDFDSAAEDAVHETEWIENSRFADLWMVGYKKGFYFKNCYAITLTGRIKVYHTGIDIDEGQKVSMQGLVMSDCSYSPASTYPCIKLGTTGNAHAITINGCIIGHADNTYSIEEKAGNLGNVIVGNNLQKAASFAAATEHAHNHSP